MVSVWISSQGDSSVKGRGRLASPKISNAQIICIQVVPHFDGVEITMSPARNSKPSQRLLSASHDRYRRKMSLTHSPLLGGDRLLIGRLRDLRDEETPDVARNAGRKPVEVGRQMAGGAEQERQVRGHHPADRQQRDGCLKWPEVLVPKPALLTMWMELAHHQALADESILQPALQRVQWAGIRSV